MVIRHVDEDPVLQLIQRMIQRQDVGDILARNKADGSSLTGWSSFCRSLAEYGWRYP